MKFDPHYSVAICNCFKNIIMCIKVDLNWSQKTIFASHLFFNLGFATSNWGCEALIVGSRTSSKIFENLLLPNEIVNTTYLAVMYYYRDDRLTEHIAYSRLRQVKCNQ